MNTANPITAPVSKRSSKILVGSILFILVVVGAILFWMGRFSSDEREIQEVLETRARAFNQKDLSLYLSCFSPNYRSGTRTYEDLKAEASRWFSQYATIKFSFQTINIQIQEGTAIVENNYTFFITKADGESVRIKRQELLEVRRENKEWKITKAL